ncbi:NAD(P)/FAD-dependent oxidoreductase [Haloferula sp. A504]|uniref:NAD(P)/FAD-dependent oxidoreductase n=1 Tax=Haloferula sp. A504 TaxID=3373601 RepID=UPI0031BE0985|nr:NAD(P)/FAD-dependent oxidoreductase [Verrucomicrobiaceae bacterium E54]
MEPKRVLILGGGFAGLSCARKLANDKRFGVTLIDRTNHHLFQPLLYQVATASLAAPDIARSLRQILEKASNVTAFMDEIDAIDTGAKTATGKSGRQYEWDYLVLATGAQTSFFGNDDWERNTLGLKTLEEAQRIRRTVLSNLEQAELTGDPAERRRLMTVAIVGGGPTGVELSGAFADLVHRSMRSEFRQIDTSTLRIILIEGSSRILEAYDEDQSEYARVRLKSLGVDVWTGRRVCGVEHEKLVFTDGRTLEASAIIWAAGVQASPLTRQFDVEPADRGGRLEPLPDLSLPGHPDVFVVGDLVRMKDIDGVPVPGVAPAAVQMGDHVAKVLKEELRLEKTRFADRKHELRPGFRYRDKGLMAIIGKNHAVVKSGKLRLRGYAAWMAWLLVHILFLIGFRNKLAVLLSWAFAYLRNSPGARIIVHPPGTEPKHSAPTPP